MFRTLIAVFVSCALNAQKVDDAGRKQGHWKKVDEKTGKLLYEGTFKDDVPVGKFRYYYPNDSVRAILSFRSDGKTAYARMFHMNGRRMAEGKYMDKEVKDSTWVYYDELGVLISKDNYKSGKKHGVSQVFFPDGKVSEERNYRDGLQHGAFKQYFDGKLLRAKGSFTNGEQHGMATYLFPNGVEAATGAFKNGVKTGPWIYKNKDGKITEKELYIDGKPASKKETDAFFSKHKSPGGPKPVSQPKAAPSKASKGS